MVGRSGNPFSLAVLSLLRAQRTMEVGAILAMPALCCEENLDFLLSRINARSEATGHPSVVAVFGFGANIGDNQLHFGLARPSEVSGLGGCYDWRTTPQLSPLAHKYLHDFSWCVMDRSRVSKGFAFTMAIADGT
ncbi:unnamed protein product [Durusdinium trenchii]|uniref:Subtilisin n=2 Tax=Durusdinium trenchii TaxID=1381693 RepID=A0ABP0LX14_9DINO